MRVSDITVLVPKKEFERLVAQHILPLLVNAAFVDEVEMVEFDYYGASERNPNGDCLIVIRQKSDAAK